MIHLLCRDVVRKLKINKFVETGTFVGETMVRVSDWFQETDPSFGTIVDRKPVAELAKFFPMREIKYPVFDKVDPASKTHIFSVDVDAEKQALLTKTFASNAHVTFVNQSSVDFLKQAITDKVLSDDDRCLFYLDAHWGAYWPLRDEIKEVLRLKKAVIVVDDFVVPFHPFYGFDAYKTQICGWYYIKDVFAGKDIKVYYPKTGNDDNRGTILLFWGYTDDELAFLKELPVFKPFPFKGAPFITSAAKAALWTLTVTGLYDPLLRFYLKRKWGEGGAPMEPH